jgi:hypothetical protein
MRLMPWGLNWDAPRPTAKRSCRGYQCVVKRKVWKRNKYRCQDCGLRVAQARALLPQIHHRVRPLLGNDSAKDPITLRLCCHATRSPVGHRCIFGTSGTEEIRKDTALTFHLRESLRSSQTAPHRVSATRARASEAEAF